jgi:hypothetical protein
VRRAKRNAPFETSQRSLDSSDVASGLYLIHTLRCGILNPSVPSGVDTAESMVSATGFVDTLTTEYPLGDLKSWLIRRIRRLLKAFLWCFEYTAVLQSALLCSSCASYLLVTLELQ